MKKKAKILLVEDDPDQIMMYEMEINNRGYTFLNATNKKDAIKIAKKEKPNVIMLDMLLGQTKGLDVLKELKKDKKTKDLKVVFLTNFKEKDLTKKALEAGALEYIIKSEHVPSEVITMIEKYI